jgi:hypothetical protein
MSKLRSILFGTAILLTTAVHAQAAIMSSSLAYNAGQNVVVCYLFNSGSASMYVTSVQIIREYAGSVGPLNPNDCNGRYLSAGQTCRAVLYAVNGNSHDCKAVVSSKTDLRGSLEVRNGTTVIAVRELR